jgi:MoxR-like ATPase
MNNSDCARSGARSARSDAASGASSTRAHAFLRHRGYVTPEDVKAIGPDVLRHRVVLSYEAEAEEVTAEDIVRRVFEVVEVP